MAASGKTGGKNRKYGREKKKRLRRGSPLSQYVRGLITFETYWKVTSKK